MGGGPPAFAQGFSCPELLRIPPSAFRLRLRGFHPLRPTFPDRSAVFRHNFRGPVPRSARTPVWAPPISLAATLGITVVFFSSGYLDVSVRRVPSVRLCIRLTVHELFSCGFPHSDIRGSTGICPSPRLFAACRVLLRLLVPRHPPRALFA